jgi:hypothetical protein
MDRHIIWIHGIGNHQPGYSAGWQAVFNPYLQLPPEAYREVCWEVVFDTGGRGAALVDVSLTRREELAAAEVREELETILQARAAALAAAADDGARGGEVVEWSALRAEAEGGRGIGDWLLGIGDYLGDFSNYLVSKRLRTAVKETAKAQLRPLAGGDNRVSVIGHSWGTVVAYDALLDLAVEAPTLQVANLITLGSPLWLVRRLLEDRSGRKPGQVATWMNIYARFDVVGSWLRPAFEVDYDYETPTVGPSPHGSYFDPANSRVQADLIAPAVLGP